MTAPRDVLDLGFPVTLRLCELPGFHAYLDANDGQLTGGERAHLGDWLVLVDAEELEAGGSFASQFESCLLRTRDELESEDEPMLMAA